MRTAVTFRFGPEVRAKATRYREVESRQEDTAGSASEQGSEPVQQEQMIGSCDDDDLMG